MSLIKVEKNGSTGKYDVNPNYVVDDTLYCFSNGDALVYFRSATPSIGDKAIVFKKDAGEEVEQLNDTLASISGEDYTLTTYLNSVTRDAEGDIVF